MYINNTYEYIVKYLCTESKRSKKYFNLILIYFSEYNNYLYGLFFNQYLHPYEYLYLKKLIKTYTHTT